jgi:predicted DNA-binding protein (MmcQ/YjbR family)
MNTPPHEHLKSLRKFALSLPEAWEDFPFGRPVIKVGKRPFMYLDSNRQGAATIAVKPRSKKQALRFKSCTPTGYGLGLGGWVTVAMRQADTPTEAVIRKWIRESYQEMLKPNPVTERQTQKPAAARNSKKRATKKLATNK